MKLLQMGTAELEAERAGDAVHGVEQSTQEASGTGA